MNTDPIFDSSITTTFYNFLIMSRKEILLNNFISNDIVLVQICSLLTHKHLTNIFKHFLF
ncbi:hypothetical protein AsACE_CH01431 [Acinetobacter schindleri]|nr:hypothetical protein AsACE_CH01431 [Acinetobacter schindleri]